MFESFIGYDAIKEELAKVVDILNNKEKYTSFGIKSPHGLMLIGSPGLGKTTLAEGVIKELGRNTYVCRKTKAKDDFIKSVEDVFEQATENQPSVILLDDFDKFANDDERHMDSEEYIAVQAGIDSVKNKDVFVIATVNNTRKLPQSLLRNGRFDTKIYIDDPNVKDATKILEFYAKDKKIAKDVDLSIIAKILDGSSCADLESFMNSSAINSKIKEKGEIDMNDMIKTCLKEINKWSSSMERSCDYREAKTLAYHEAGHLVVSELLSSGDVVMVSIQQSSNSDKVHGVTITSNKDTDFDEDVAMDKITNATYIALAGRASVEVALGKVDCGSAEDIHRAHIVQSNILRYLAKDSLQYVDACFSDILEIANYELAVTYNKVKSMLFKNKEFLDKIANALMDKQTLILPEIQAIKNTCTLVY